MTKSKSVFPNDKAPKKWNSVESPAFVQKQLGHHSIQMTVDIYGHLIPSTAKISLESAFEKKHEIPPSNREAIYLIRCGKSGDTVKFIKEIVK